MSTKVMTTPSILSSRGQIGPHPHVVPTVVVAGDFAPDRRQICEYPAHILDQVVVFEPMSEVRDRPSLVGLLDAEQVRHPVGETLDMQAGVEEQGAEIRRRHQVFQIAVGARYRVEFHLEFAVDGLQLLVDRLQLFLAGFQFLGSRSVFLVDRL